MNDDEDFERELAVALRRVEAPARFAEGVTARAERGRVLAFPVGRRAAWMGSLAASLLVGAVLVERVEHRRAEAQAERARAESDFARSLEITNRAMALTRERLQKAGVVVD